MENKCIFMFKNKNKIIVVGMYHFKIYLTF